MNPAGRGSAGAVLAPPQDGAEGPGDGVLVARVRRGDDRAFEALYERYHRRIHAFVLGMVKDHGRAEDVTQEVFVSALRRMRETEQPLAFKPWLYQIARNSCIDAFRRSRRAEEVSYDADGALAPADHSKLVASGPSPDAAVAAKQDLDDLCGAFGGLSETHHEILVLRELEGLSYAEIGRRMGMSRPAVESTLFRARRRLTEEFDDIVSGARCQRVQGIIVAAAESRLGARDTRRLARHLSHCQSCRREALAAGLDRGLLARPPLRERIASRIAGLLPFPLFERFRRGADAAPPPSGGRGASLAAHLPMFSDQLAGAWGKAAAGAALLVAGVGAGVGVQQVSRAPDKPAAVRASQAPSEGKTRAVAAATPERVAPLVRQESTTTKASSRAGKGERKRGSRRGGDSRGGKGTNRPSAADRATPVGGGSAQPAAAAGDSSSNRSSQRDGQTASQKKKPEATKPSETLPSVSTPAAVADPVRQTGDVVNTTVQNTGDTVKKVVSDVTDAVDNAVQNPGAVGQVVDQVTDVVNDVVGNTTQGLNQTTGQLTGALNGITGSGG
ncbi:MAG TPA: RNA polymerase sigma factor [Solirubrobacter sp.]|jgi:RNA polymerase sigma factor (sigma-70 family)|nr:RNA polymerase sigma factor [Solirubrobacter sp.]